MANNAVREFYLKKSRIVEKAADEESRMRRLIIEKRKFIRNRRREYGGLMLRSIKQEVTSKQQANSSLFDPQTWINAGYTYDDVHLSGGNAKSLIRSVALETFKLRDDTKKDHLLAKMSKQMEAMTRKHIGVRDWGNVDSLINRLLLQNDPIIDASVLLYYNIATLSNVSDDIDSKWANAGAINAILNDKELGPQIKIGKILDHLNNTNDFESPTDLAYRVVSLETSAVLKKATMETGTLKQSLNNYLANLKSENSIKKMKQSSVSGFRTLILKQQLETKRVSENEMQDATISSMMDLLKSGDMLLIDTNSTAR